MNFGDLNNQGGNNSDAPQGGSRSSDQKRRRKLIWAGAILAVLVAAVGGWQYWQYTQSDYYKQMKGIKELEKMAEESDKWGGKTPEETVRLFTEAVKKGDFELASKYGISNVQSEIKDTLNSYKNSEYWQNYLKWLDSVKKSDKKDYNFGPNSVTYESFDDQGRRVVFISLQRSDIETWKIDEF